MSIATVSGMDRVTGAALSGRAHMRQSIMDILTTPIGSRVGQREYGSRLPELIDAPLNEQGRQAIYAATAGLSRAGIRLSYSRISHCRIARPARW